MTASEPLRGLWCATLTPLFTTGAIHHALLVEHITELLAEGVDGIVLFGTTGEGPSFSASERRSGLEAVLTGGIDTARLAVAAGCAALPDTESLVRHAVQSGCPRCLILPPFFWKGLSDEAVFRYYAALIDQVGDDRLRIYLYHFPQLSGVPIRPKVAARLAAAYPGIIAGVKDSSGDYANTSALLECAPTLSILVGHERDIPRLMLAGGAGTICGLANIYPRLIRGLLDATETAEDEARLDALLQTLLPYPFVPAFKAVRAEQTGNHGWRAVRPPLLPLDDEARQTLVTRLHQAQRTG